MVKGVGAPQKGAVHGPVDPVETEVGKNEPKEYLQHAGQIAETGKNTNASRVEQIHAALEEALRGLARHDDDEQGENVKRQLTSPVHRVPGAATLLEVDDQDNENKSDGLVDLLFHAHSRSMAQNRS